MAAGHVPSPFNNSSRSSQASKRPPAASSSHFRPPPHTYILLVHAPAGFIYPIPFFILDSYFFTSLSRALFTPLTPLISRASCLSLCAWSYCVSLRHNNPISDKPETSHSKVLSSFRFLIYHQHTLCISQVRSLSKAQLTCATATPTSHCRKHRYQVGFR